MNTKLNVRPVFVMFAHKYYYEGPCRMAGGDAIKPGFDEIMNGHIIQGNMAQIKQFMPDCVNLLDMVTIEVTDDWDIKEEYFDTLLKGREETDVYLASNTFGADAVFNEFCIRANKPVVILPNIWNPAKSGYLYNMNVDVYTELTWEDTVKRIKNFAVRKAIAKSNILLVPRFNYDMPKAGATDTFVDLNAVTALLGTHFRTVNLHELLDYMKPLSPDGNYTTPGRITPNITNEEIQECMAAAKELIAGAQETEIEEEFVVRSLIANKTVLKTMDHYDCNAVVIPCPDCCSTRRMNQEKFTFCLNHSLNIEMGLPSTCEYDVASAVTMLALIAISGKAPYMGNTLPLVFDDEKSLARQIAKSLPEEDIKNLLGMDNLYMVAHSTPNRKFKGINAEPMSYALRHFAYDQGFGACMRHDFNEDKGQIITLAKFSGDLKRLFIGKGTIVQSFGYKLNNCNGGFVFRVEDQKAFYRAQCTCGLHLPLVFGDITQELGMLAESYGIEPLFV